MRIGTVLGDESEAFGNSPTSPWTARLRAAKVASGGRVSGVWSDELGVDYVLRLRLDAPVEVAVQACAA